MAQSRKYKLNKEDGKKILAGLLIALAGAALTFAEEAIPLVDFGTWTPLAVAINSAVVNAGRKWIVGKY